MFYSTLAIAVTAFTTFASAQNYSTSGGNLTIDPNSVDYPTRQSWCRAETNSCPQICGGQASANDCNPNTLTYNCVCSSGNQPNISDYDQTLPSLVCGQWVADCVNAHPNDLDGQTACLSVVCGSRNASSGISTSSTMMTSASATASSSGGSGGAGGAQQTASSSSGSGSGSGSGSSTASGSSGAASATSSSAAYALNLASNYGTGILAAGILGAFGLAL